MLAVRDLTLEALDGHPPVSGVTLRVPPGGNLLLTGAAGRARNRLLKALAGTERPSMGSVQVGGVEVWPGRGAFALAGKVKVGFAFARGGLLANLSVRDNVALPLRFQGLATGEVAVRVTAALEALDLVPVAGLRPHAVSDAARKHANLARVLALEPELILLDDPLLGLESGDRAKALSLIQSWAADSRRTLVLAAEEAEPYTALGADHLALPPVPLILESP